MIVVDASAVTELLLLGPLRKRIEDQITALGSELHAPALIDLEVLNALRRLRVSSVRGDEAVADLLDLPITRYRHEGLLPRTWQLRQNFTAYDAAYVALAEAIEAPLLTSDAKLARAVKRHTEVEVLLPR